MSASEDVIDLTARMKPGAPNRAARTVDAGALIGAPADNASIQDDHCTQCGARWYRVTCVGGCGSSWTTTRPPDGSERCPNCVGGQL